MGGYNRTRIHTLGVFGYVISSREETLIHYSDTARTQDYNIYNADNVKSRLHSIPILHVVTPTSGAYYSYCNSSPIVVWPVTDEFPSQRDSNAENVSIWWPQRDRKCILFEENICTMDPIHNANIYEQYTKVHTILHDVSYRTHGRPLRTCTWRFNTP